MGVSAAAEGEASALWLLLWWGDDDVDTDGEKDDVAGRADPGVGAGAASDRARPGSAVDERVRRGGSPEAATGDAKAWVAARAAEESEDEEEEGCGGAGTPTGGVGGPNVPDA